MLTLISDSNPIREEVAGAMYAMPATPLQSMLWNLASGCSADPSWNVAVRFRLSGPLDREMLEASLQRLTDRHEALRTGLAVDEGRFVQRISARATLSVEWCDLRGLDDEAQQQEAIRLSNEHACQRLPLDAAPMWRVRLLRLSSAEHWMLWNLSHAICDGWSVGLLAKDLMREYGDRRAGNETSRENTLDYGDYAVWLEAERQTPAYEAHRRYWNDRLRHVRAAAPPAEWSNRDDAAALPVLQSRLLPRELTDRLAAVAQGCDSTFFHAVLAVFALRIRSEQDSPELILGTPVSGRDQPELEAIIGTFVNYVPLRLRIEADSPYRDVVRAVRDVASESLEHASYRFEDILADLGQPGAPVQASKLFSSVFICQRDFVHPETSAGLTLTAMPSVSAGSLRPLTVFMVERADGWRLSCEVDNRVVSAKAGAKLLEDLERMMEAAAANPERAVPSLAQQTRCSRSHHNDLGGLAETRPFGQKAQPPDVPDEGQINGVGESALKRVRATETQHRFWLLDELNPGNASFDLSIRLEMKGPLDPAAFKSAANLLIERNEILRTTFEEEDGQLWQIIHPRGVLDFQYVESEGSPSGLNEPLKDVSKRFSLQKGPLFRIRLFRIGAETHRLSIDLSHAIADGWSSGLFLEQLRDAYLAILSGSHVESRALPLQFSSYAADERELLTDSETERRIEWWAQHLDGPWPPLSLPKDVEKTAGHNDCRAGVSCTAIAPSAIISARRFARESNSTLFAVFGAALQSLLARYSGQENILFITPFANRSGDREAILGPVAMPICLTGRVVSGTTFRDLVKGLSTQSLEAVEHILPFSQVASLLNANVNANDGHHVLNQIAFFFQRAFVDEMQWGSLHVAPLPEFHAATGVEWQLGVVERKRGFSAEFLYSPAQYSERTMSLVGVHYTRLLTFALANPDVPVSQLNILTPDEIAAKAENLPTLPVTQKLLNPSSPAGKSELPAVVCPAAPLAVPISSAGSEVAEFSDSERGMVRLWQPLFRNEHIELDSNFFDLGGHSLLMARLQIALKKEFNVQLAVADVFQYPTVRDLAAWLDRARSQGTRISSAVSNPRIIPIQPHGSATPIFVISQSMIFRGLAAALGEDQPVYALQMLDEDITPEMAAADFERLTEFYIQLIRKVQPQGPYRLAGWCVSGWIGYGIARRLEHEGEEIELLMIMDAWAPGYWIKRSFARRTLMRVVYRFQRLRWVGHRLLKASREERSLYIRRSLHGTAAAAARNVAVWLHRMDLPVQVRLTEEMRPSEQLEYTATRTFETGALEGEVLIFRSEEQSRGPLLAEDMGWSELIGRSITVEQLPGDHQEIFNRAGAQLMARAARRVLRDSPAGVGSAGSGDAVPSPA